MLFNRIIVQLDEQRLFQVNPTRTSFILFNNHASATIYIHQTKGIGLGGFPVKAGGSAAFKVPEDNPINEIWIISDTADTDCRYYEGFGYLDERWFKPT